MDNKTIQNDREEKERADCAECRRELLLGNECIRCQLGVIGARGFVPLGEPTHLCDHECARRYYLPEEDVKRLQRRIP